MNAATDTHDASVPEGRTIVLIAGVLQSAPAGGRALLSRLNHDILADILGPRLVTFEVRPSRLRGWRAIKAIFSGSIDGLNDAVVARAIHTVREMRANKVFVDGSNLGKVVRAIKRACPGVEVSTFFHNCEARFFLGSFRQAKTIRSLGVLLANWLAERRTVRFSDNLICLNERDSAQLRALYGRGATHVSPIALQDRLPAVLPAGGGPDAERYALFVGGTFYANHAGIAWFAEHVAPRIPIKTRVVGAGFELLKQQLERHGNVEVIGSVESVAPWYLGAQFVVAPIFDGSGMKTKVAEALMFGKMIVGTPEAFAGYEDVAVRAGLVCSTASDFVNAIDRVTKGPVPEFNPELRALYEQKYSFGAARSRLAQILDIAGAEPGDCLRKGNVPRDMPNVAS